MAEAVTAYIGLGSNLGQRKMYVEKALKMLGDIDGIDVSTTSDLIETAALAGKKQPNYINAVAEIKTTLKPSRLHEKTSEIEKVLGRERGQRWQARTIDLDILLFGCDVINIVDLIVPHPQMHLRSFVLKGLCQLNSRLLHPVIKEPMEELAVRLNGCDFMFCPKRPQLVAIAGNIGAGKTTLTENLCGALDCKTIRESYSENPFMPDVYAGKKELALDSQLFFLTSRVRQLNFNILEEGKILLSDYIFDKELIYARLLLNPQQLDIYEVIYPSFAGELATPVLVIYLTDSAPNCLDRIHKRNRPYEQEITLEFLTQLNDGYDELFDDWKTSPFIRLSMSEFDCMNKSHIARLADQIKSYVVI